MWCYTPDRDYSCILWNPQSTMWILMNGVISCSRIFCDSDVNSFFYYLMLYMARFRMTVSTLSQGVSKKCQVTECTEGGPNYLKLILGGKAFRKWKHALGENWPFGQESWFSVEKYRNLDFLHESGFLDFFGRTWTPNHCQCQFDTRSTAAPLPK